MEQPTCTCLGDEGLGDDGASFSSTALKNKPRCKTVLTPEGWARACLVSTLSFWGRFEREDNGSLGVAIGNGDLGEITLGYWEPGERGFAACNMVNFPPLNFFLIKKINKNSIKK